MRIKPLRWTILFSLLSIPIFEGCQELERIPADIGERVHPVQVASVAHGQHTVTNNLSHSQSQLGQRVSDQPNPDLHVFGLWEEGEDPEKTLTGTGRTRKPGYTWFKNMSAVKRMGFFLLFDRKLIAEAEVQWVYTAHSYNWHRMEKTKFDPEMVVNRMHTCLWWTPSDHVQLKCFIWFTGQYLILIVR